MITIFRFPLSDAVFARGVGDALLRSDLAVRCFLLGEGPGDAVSSFARDICRAILGVEVTELEGWSPATLEDAAISDSSSVGVCGRRDARKVSKRSNPEGVWGSAFEDGVGGC